VKTAIIWFVIGCVLCGLTGYWMSGMPGDSVKVTVPLTSDQQTVAEDLSLHVDALASDAGARGVYKPTALEDAGAYLTKQLERAGYNVRILPFTAGGQKMTNLDATLAGTQRGTDIIVIGAHYDSLTGSPGANDNASGCAVLLEVAKALAETSCERTVRFALFANGAGDVAGDERSGSSVYARDLRKNGDKVVAMLSLDSLGTYRDTPGSQKLSFPLSLAYPKTGNFVLFAGDMGSRDLVRTCVGEFRKTGRLPSEGLAAPESVSGITASDDIGFRAQGFPAIVVTDTGKLRNDRIGTAADTPEKLDYQRMARLTSGLVHLVKSLGSRATSL
jgi:Zn-dependent M28 family amino/carboxypeptidase